MPTVLAVTMPLSRERLLTIARTLPADLSVLSKLSEMLQDPNSELDNIAALLRRDVALASKIVRIGNSPMFGGGRKVASAEEAVNCVGFGEVLKLVGTATAGRLSEASLPCYNLSARSLRANMLYAALAAEALARPANLDPRVAYNAGLLRAVGLMVLDRAGRDTVPQPIYAPQRWPDYVAWECSSFGVTSCEATAIILDEWQFPAELGAAVRAHHLIQPADREQPLAVVLNLANGLAQRVSRSFQGEDCRWEITPEKLSLAGLTEDDLEPARTATEKAFAAASAALAA